MAWYGSPNDNTCGADVTNIAAPNFIGLSQGSIVASNNIFGDPCPGIVKILSISLTSEPISVPAPAPYLNAPNNVSATVNGNSINVTWDPPTDSGTPVERYAIFWSYNQYPGWAISSTTTSATITNLPYTTDISIRVRSDNDTLAVYSDFSSILVTTPAEIIPEPIIIPTPEPTIIPDPTPTETPTPVPTPEITPVPIPSPSPQPAPEPIFYPTPSPEPVVDPIIEPILDPIVEPTPEPVIEPTPEPVVEPTPEPTPEPTIDSTLIEVVIPEPIVVVPLEPSTTPSIIENKESTKTKEEKIVVKEETLSNLLDIKPENMSKSEVSQLIAIATAVLSSSPEGSKEYDKALKALFVAAQADDIKVSEEISNIPGIGPAAVAVVDTINFIGNIGSDMSPEHRDKAKKEIIAAVVATGAAIGAISMSNSSSPTGGSSGSTGGSRTNRNNRREI